MRINDFDSCTPLEFEKMWKTWKERNDMAMRGEWERTRMLALAMIQPHCSNPVKKTDVMRFDWDEDEKEEVEKSTLERFEEVKKKAGF